METCKEVYDEVHKRRLLREKARGTKSKEDSIYVNVADFFRFVWSVCCILNVEKLVKNYRGTVLARQNMTCESILLIVCSLLLLHSIYRRKVYSIKIK